MKIRYAPDFLQKLKKLNVRIRRNAELQLTIFLTNPYATKLNNHKLRRSREGFRSINITNDYRALYSEKKEGDETVAYFEEIGTHKELYNT